MSQASTVSRVLLVGSSIAEQWSTAPARFAELFPHAGFHNAAIGGTTTEDWRTSLPAVLAAQSPDLVLIYCGSNDVNHGASVTQITDNMVELVAMCAQVAYCALYAVIKAPQKAGHYADIDAINAAYARIVEARSGGIFIPTNDALGADRVGGMDESEGDYAACYQPDVAPNCGGVCALCGLHPQCLITGVPASGLKRLAYSVRSSRRSPVRMKISRWRLCVAANSKELLGMFIAKHLTEASDGCLVGEQISQRHAHEAHIVTVVLSE